ncbi:hypothetical protein EVAR_81928_1 [Eumeta japonica]|uniref:Uncharacterized protein n=1 Tax=Eumeta variegata TaxID=151549 RepID=A0A4C1UX47_EUMVA|nr:hypothetical protein EVAR_81928_1 [Eumeta japonica]
MKAGKIAGCDSFVRDTETVAARREVTGPKVSPTRSAVMNSSENLRARTAQRPKLCHSELAANDILRRCYAPRPFLLLRRVPISRHCDAFVTNFMATKFRAVSMQHRDIPVYIFRQDEPVLGVGGMQKGTLVFFKYDIVPGQPSFSRSPSNLPREYEIPIKKRMPPTSGITRRRTPPSCEKWRDLRATLHYLKATVEDCQRVGRKQHW